jgi:hypothetical protein
MLAAASVAAAPAQSQERYWAITPELISKHDEYVDTLLERQTKDASSRWRGGLPDADGLHNGGSAAATVGACATALVQEKSRHFRSGAVTQGLVSATEFLKRHTSTDGNIHLLITNFNSPPDTAFATNTMATAALLARKHNAREISELVEPILRTWSGGLVKGGIHTPNHRWVLCAALTQLNELFPDPGFVGRIDQWLAEGIDIDPDGQYTERSTVVYNAITNRALTVMAVKLNRPTLLDPVRKNLDSMLYLIDAGYETVTAISRRQDRNTRGGLERYWMPLRYLAMKDGNGVYESLARAYPASLTDLMEYPELMDSGPVPSPAPADYVKVFPALKVARVRRGSASATVVLEGDSRFVTLRRGNAVVEAVRFSSAFFGKGQFVPTAHRLREGAFEMTQALEGPYYQPLDPPRKVGTEEWEETRKRRKQTEVCRMRYAAEVAEFQNGFRVRMRAEGTDDVPVAIEIALREGGTIEGCETAPRVNDGYLLAQGEATYRRGGDTLRFGPGRKEHTYTQVRGAHEKWPGPCVYLTGYTPFDHTLEFRWA